ncbi:MAG: menaquinone biosynthesis decarboxylase [Nitrospinae bacterium]|nr:menaquinone biosynthesis decarboxylase [Nitrospinota bacterium]
MRTTYSSLHDFIRRLETEGELVRVRERVSPILEITEITDRVSKGRDGGKALLFENAEGSAVPVLINAFGSRKRIRMALGVGDIEEIARDIREIIEFSPPKTISGKLSLLPKLFDLIKIPPRVFKGAVPPCQEVVLTGDNIDLEKFPVLKCWPGDGGRFITLPLVFTRSPLNGRRNVGMYRMQVYGKNTTGMHWHIHKDGARHFREHKELKKRMEVAVAIGADPVVTYAATAPLPPDVDEILLAGFIRKKGVEMAKCKTVNLEVPATAEIVLEGYVDPEESRVEGPFGDHTGYYSLAAPYPVFHVTAVTHRKNAVYHTTIVGKPPMEDCYIGKATERIFLPLLKTVNHDIVDISLPWEGVFHNCVVAAIKKSYPFHARQTMNSLWGTGQMGFSKMVLVVDSTKDPHDYPALVRDVLNRVDLTKDLYFSDGALDALDHSSPTGLYGSKLGVDATSRLPGEGDVPAKRRNETVPEEQETLNMVRALSPHARDIAIPARQVQNPILFIALEKRKAFAARETAEIIFQTPGLGAFRIVVVFDSETDVKNNSVAVWKFFNNTDPKRDLHFFQDKLCVDATRKWKEEGFQREWPDELEMTEEVKMKVDGMWGRLGA